LVDDLDVLWSTKVFEQECRQPQTTKFYTKECTKKHKQSVGLVKEHISWKDALSSTPCKLQHTIKPLIIGIVNALCCWKN